MAHWRSNTSCATVKSRFAWRWLRKGNNGKQARKTVRFLDAERPTNMMVYMASLQNPPSGPPLITVGD